MRKKIGAQKYGKRSIQIRPTLPVVTIACDDTKTAAAYFVELKREVKASVTVNVKCAPRCGATADDVFAHALEISKSLEPTQAGDSTWALVDTEVSSHTQIMAEQVKLKASKSNVKVLLSKPCFEVWTLAHLADTGENFQDCSAVLSQIKIHWKKRFGIDFGKKKSQVEYGRLMPLKGDAVRNSKNRIQHKNGSWTEVFKVVEAIASLVAKITAGSSRKP